jgi:hypothetical protein
MRIREYLLSPICCGLLATMAVGQTPEIQDAKNKQLEAERLEASIADALKYNPKIQTAQAQVREAEIKLNEARNTVIVQVAAAYRVLAKSKEVLKTAEEIYQAALDVERRKINASAPSIVLKAKSDVDQAAANVAQCEAELMKLVGRVPGLPAQHGTGTAGTVGFTSDGAFLPDLRLQYDLTDRLPNPKGTAPSSGTPTKNPQQAVPFSYPQSNPSPFSDMADKLTLALVHPLKIEKEFKNVPVHEVLGYIHDHAMKDIPMRFAVSNAIRYQIDLMAGELPLSAWLQAVQDTVPELRFVVREYGLLVTTADRVPNDGLLLGDFVRRIKVPRANSPEPDHKEKPPMEVPPPGKPK